MLAEILAILFIIFVITIITLASIETKGNKPYTYKTFLGNIYIMSSLYIYGLPNVEGGEKCCITDCDKAKDESITISFNNERYDEVKIPFEDITDFRIVSTYDIDKSIGLDKIFFFGIYSLGMEKKKNISVENFLQINYKNKDNNEECSLLLKPKNVTNVYDRYISKINEAHEKVDNQNFVNCREDNN